MFELMESQQENAVIKVIGVGGGGGNAVEHMVAENIDGVEFIPVCKFPPKHELTQQLYKLRKDSLEYIK
jgi:hypothetical protein